MNGTRRAGGARRRETETGRASVPLLDRPVTTLQGVGPRVAERLARLGIHDVRDLLFHLPQRYEDRTQVHDIGALRAGEQAVIRGTVELSQVKFGRRRSLLVRVADGTGALMLRFFHFSAQQQQSLSRGARLRCFGEVRRGPATLEMVHPEYRVEEQREPASRDDADDDTLTPIYPTTERLHQLSLRRLTGQALALLATDPDGVAELLPDAVLEPLRLPALGDALRLVHRPPADAGADLLASGRHPAQRRLAFEELLAHHLSMRQARQRVLSLDAPALDAPGALAGRLRDSLPFALTGAQERVFDEIRADLARDVPMLRLVQGDVGSGKTVVAALAALQAIESGRQVALMAPTELLAEQHRRSFEQWFAPLGIEVAWLSGKSTPKARRDVMQGLDTGRFPIAIGTHALFQEGVTFPRLGLIVIDEQHRFGVHQRLALREKGRRDGLHPHQLIMTATPIPRTLAMTAYADLDSSVIDELPPGRKPVETSVVPASRRADVVDRVHKACAGGQQAYWVCTLIDESEALECSAASDTAAELAAALPDLHVGLVHGRLKAAEKEAVMGEFLAGRIDLLVATTVIEVGVDVPNASLMIIDNAERLGLAQIHQLRGRVGRGARQSHCVLLYQGRLSANARARLGVLRETGDGFEIARRDLELRGPGEILGTRQTGLLQLRVADLFRDRDLLPDIARAADALLAGHPACVQPLIDRWLGSRPDYDHV